VRNLRKEREDFIKREMIGDDDDYGPTGNTE